MANWFQHLEEASNMDELVAIVRDHFATWTPEELALLPPACRPGKMKGPQDLEDLHAALVVAYRASPLQGEALVAMQRLTSFVVRASMRSAQLLEGDSSPRSAASRRS